MTTVMMLLRAATADDAPFLYRLRTDPVTAAASPGPVPEWEAHEVWVQQSLASAERRLWIAESDNGALATVRLDRVPTMSDGAFVSITVAPEVRGRGLATAVLAEVTRVAPVWGVRNLYAVIKPENVASQRAFAKAGYAQGQEDTWWRTCP